MKSLCGTECEKCGLYNSCFGCVSTKGKPFGGKCILAECCKSKQSGFCDCFTEENVCGLKSKLIDEFNALGI